MARRLFETFLFAVAGLQASACGTDAVGVDACRQVQEAECQEAPACGIALEPPYHTTGTAVDACIRFYNDQCLHGLASGTDPGLTAVHACVAAIHSAAMTSGGCSVVANPSTSAACAWLAVNTPATDAASEPVEAAMDDGDANNEGGDSE
ncbi:MAG: hypothetical protein WBY94_13450 [Polyangiaceae bacterium]